MKCLTCGRFCLQTLCRDCLESIPLRPSVREVMGVRVYCFYGYDDVSLLINTKYHVIGSRVLSLLARKAAGEFVSMLASSLPESRLDSGVGDSGGIDSGDLSAGGLESMRSLGLVGIDDYVRSFYSHTGVLVREFTRATHMRALYGKLRAQNPISYAGKPLAYRKANKRDFCYLGAARELVLIDDIITTGTSFEEAISVCVDSGARVHFCLALCNARS